MADYQPSKETMMKAISAPLLLGGLLMLASPVNDTFSADNKDRAVTDLPARLGEYYDAVVPDTLDLAERAKLGVHHFVSIMDEDFDCQMRWMGDHNSMDHGLGMFSVCQPKAFEAMAMLRVMSGSQEGLDREEKMVEMMVSLLGNDGLWWTPADAKRMPLPEPQEMFPYLAPHGAARMMRAMIAWYQYTGDARWKEQIDRMVEAFDRILLVHKGDYAYIPVPDGRTASAEIPDYLRPSYIRDRGWKGFVEPIGEKATPGTEGSVLCHTGNYPGVLANWYLISGNEQALRLSGETARFYTQPRFWADWEGGEYPGVVGAEHAHWHGHVHGYINTLRAVLEYAIAANDPQLKAFVRDGYEWTRQPTLARFGFLGDCQGCGCGRLIGLAVKLSYTGVGDYWEDVDTYVRNIHAEMQFTPEDFPDLAKDWEVKAGSGKVGPREAMIGGFGGTAHKGWWALCCSPHGNMGLFYAWDGILRYSDGVAQVNLLLNRASPWMDIDSYLPYEGKVVLKNKVCREAFVRIPLWVEKDAVVCRIGERAAQPAWFGRYMRFEHLKQGDVMTIEFPILKRTEQWTGPSSEGWDWPKSWSFSARPTAKAATTFTLKGNTIVDISQPIIPDSPLFLSRAEKYRSDKAAMIKVKRFVTPMVLKW